MGWLGLGGCVDEIAEGLGIGLEKNFVGGGIDIDAETKDLIIGRADVDVELGLENDFVDEFAWCLKNVFDAFFGKEIADKVGSWDERHGAKA